MKRQRSRTVERLYDVALDECIGERSVAPDMVERVTFGLMMGPRAELSENLTLSPRFWFGPFGAAATAAVLLVVVGVAYYGGAFEKADHQAGRSSKLVSGDDPENPAPEQSAEARIDIPYAQVRSVQDVALLGNDVRAIQCDGVGAREIDEIVKRRFTQLESMSFSRCQFGAARVRALGMLESVKRLEFVECGELSDSDLLELGALPQLQRIVLERCVKISIAGVSKLQVQRSELAIDVTYSDPESTAPSKSHD